MPSAVSGFDEAIPGAAALVESLRGVGYSAPTAIADLLDNSIAAGARRVWIHMAWDGPGSRVIILDDGNGMSEAELIEAMRPGSRSPKDQRAPGDLGRFGLGLKTASFSQARRLTVASKTHGGLAIRRWDLDHVVLTDKWQLLRGLNEGTDPALLDELSSLDTGTLVVWEKIDRIVGAEAADNRGAQDAFFRLCTEVENHLGMVFHRFLEPTRATLRLYFNGRSERSRVRAWDPFLTEHPATWTSPVEGIPTAEGMIQFQGYVLPHQDRLTTEQFRAGGGPDGWLAQQGFYVYRNRRLIVAGGWFGLGEGRAWTRDEPFKLARLRIEIPNSADEAWRIDIKKSTARPPDYVRTRLRDLAEQVRRRARRVFAYRGVPAAYGRSDRSHRLWLEADAGGRYRIDRGHPLVKAAVENSIAPDVVEGLLRSIEVTVPVERIWLDIAERGETPAPIPEAAEPDLEMAAAIMALYRHFRSRGRLSAADARARLLRTEPFDRFPIFIRALPDDLSEEETGSHV